MKDFTVQSKLNIQQFIHCNYIKDKLQLIRIKLNGFIHNAILGNTDKPEPGLEPHSPY